MAGSFLLLRVACLVAVWAAVMSDANAIREFVMARRHQTILLPCRTDCQGAVSIWAVNISPEWNYIRDASRTKIGTTTYIRHHNASLTIENPDWEGGRDHRCQCEQKYTDTHITIMRDVRDNEDIADVRDNENIAGKVGGKILIPCVVNSKRKITESVAWHFAQKGRPYYPVSTDSGTRHSVDYNKSLLINGFQKEDVGMYLCKVGDQTFYTTKLKINKDRPPSTTTDNVASPTTTTTTTEGRPTSIKTPSTPPSTPSPNKGASGMNPIVVYIVVSVLCMALICGVVCYAGKKWKIRRGNNPDSTNGKYVYKSTKQPPPVYDTIDPLEASPGQECIESAEGQSESRDAHDNNANIPPIVYDTVGPATPAPLAPDPNYATVSFNDCTSLYSVPHGARAVKISQEEEASHVHYAEVAIY